MLNILISLFVEHNLNENKDVILSAIENLMFETKNVNISKYAYNEALIKNLCLTATTISFDEGIEISNEVKKILKNNHINAYFYKNGEELTISNDKILGQNYKDVISDSTDIYIENNINDLENLKYIKEHKIIHITQSDEFQNDGNLLEDYDSLYNIIYELRKNGQNNKVIINIKNRSKFSKSKLYNSNFDFDVEGLDIKPYNIAELKKEDQLLDLMIADIKNSNYSVFEKYIAVYNIVKRFKGYLESENDKSEARDIRKFLNNEYMVCVGYAKLLQELLNRLGIATYYYSVLPDISYDNGFTIEEKSVEFIGHARVILNINDPKYNINGFYIADPTWDNDLENDYYNHALMSFDKTCHEKRMFGLNNEDLIMNVKSMEEFSFKVNFLIEREKENPSMKNLSEEQKETKAIETLVNVINNILISLLPEKYFVLKKQFPNIAKKKAEIKEINDFITAAGEIFIDNLGRDVKINTVIEAASIVNKDVFGFNEKGFQVYKEELLEDNKAREKLEFPYYYNNNKIK